VVISRANKFETFGKTCEFFRSHKTDGHKILTLWMDTYEILFTANKTRCLVDEARIYLGVSK